MKLSYRDKVVLIVLIVIAVWVVGVIYFIKPKFEELDDKNKEFDAQVVVLEKKKDEIKQDEGLKDRVNETYNQVVSVVSNFYDKMTSDEVSTTIDNILDEDNITNDSLSISAYGSITLDYINASPIDAVTEVDRIANQSNNLGVVSDDGAITEVTEKMGPVNIPAYTVSFGYTCSLEDLQSFLDKLLTRNEKSLVVTNCTIADVHEETINGSMTLVLMMMPRMKNPIEANNANNNAAAS